MFIHTHTLSHIQMVLKSVHHVVPSKQKIICTFLALIVLQKMLIENVNCWLAHMVSWECLHRILMCVALDLVQCYSSTWPHLICVDSVYGERRTYCNSACGLLRIKSDSFCVIKTNTRPLSFWKLELHAICAPLRISQLNISCQHSLDSFLSPYYFYL